MIITCEQCSTQFQLDDARVPERGARVRCSLCKHAFFVKPATSSGDPVENAVARALAGESEVAAPASPVPTPEESGPSGSGAGQDDTPFEQALDQAESDWRFNQEAGGPGTAEDGALAAAAEAVDDLLGGASGAAGAGDIDAFLGAPGAGTEPESTGDGPFDPPQDDLGAGMDSLDDALLGAPGTDLSALADGPSEELSGLDLAEPVGAPDAVAEPGAEEGLGSPESWDFLSDAVPSAAPARPTMERSGPAGIGDAVLAERREAPPIEIEGESSKLGLLVRRAADGIAWAFVTATLAVAVHGSLARAGRSAPVASTEQEVAGLRASSVAGRWVENAGEGTIFVVSGELRGAGGGRAPRGTWLAVRLLDAEGGLVDGRAAAVGPALPASRIREAGLAELRAAQASRALSVVSAPFGAGGARRFHAVLGVLPAEAERFELAAVPVEEGLPTADGPDGPVRSGGGGR